jgi:hypothetical protein
MNQERWPEVKSILERALEIPSAERETFVSGACHGDDDLLQEVKQYLACTTAAEMLLPEGGFSEMAVAASGGTPPERVGPYRIVREIGRGGMGIVCLGERTMENTSVLSLSS